MKVVIETNNDVIIIEINNLTDIQQFNISREKDGKIELVERVNEELVAHIAAIHIPSFDALVKITTSDLTLTIENVIANVEDAIRFAIKIELKRDLNLYDNKYIWERSEIVRIMGVI